MIKRYDVEIGAFGEELIEIESPTGAYVRFEDHDARIREKDEGLRTKDEEIAELHWRIEDLKSHIESLSDYLVPGL